MDKRQTVSAIVVTYNRKLLLLKCLDSLLSQTHPLDAIYIIDNASTDGTPHVLRERGYITEYINLDTSYLENQKTTQIDFSNGSKRNIEICYFRSPENEGGAGGFSRGVEKAYGQGYNWLWLMDDDVCVEQDTLKNLLCYKDRAQVLIPLKISNDREIVDWCAIQYDLANPFKRDPKVPVRKKYSSLEQMPETLEVYDFAFEGPLINREVIYKVGYPRKDFFIYVDDTEYSLRIRKHGWKLLLIKKALIIKQIKNTKPFSSTPWKDYYYKRNLFWVHKVYGENFLVRYVKPVLFFLGAIVMRGFLRWDWVKIKIIYFAYMDAVTNRLFNRYKP